INSAAAALQLGVAQGGIEVSGFAAARPAPTGFFTRFGDPDLSNLTNFAGSQKSNFGKWTLTDTGGVGPHSATPTFPSGTRMYEGAASSVGIGSFVNVRQNLQVLADSINANTSKKWKATLQGLRLVLRSQFNGPNSDTTATLTSDGGFNIGDPNQLFSGP